MVANHFTSIGFNVSTKEDLNALIQRAMKEGEDVSCPNGAYVKWAIGAGIELWVHLDTHGRKISSFSPHFSGPSRAILGITEIRNDPSIHTLLEGSIDAWAAPRSEDPKTGLYPLTLDVPDFDALRTNLKLGGKYTFQIAAFGHSLSCFKDEEAFKAEQLKHPVGVRDGHPYTFGPESFIPTGQFTRITGGKLKAEAMFSGLVSETEELTNPFSGRNFLHLLVRTYGIDVDIVADPTIVKGSPIVGGIVIGTFWMSGRLASTK